MSSVITRPHRSTMYVDAAYFFVTDGVPWSVCLSVIMVSPAKMAEPIKMLLGLLSWVGPGKCDPDCQTWRDNFEGGSECSGMSRHA